MSTRQEDYKSGQWTVNSEQRNEKSDLSQSTVHSSQTQFTEIILPVIEQEVNAGKNFAPLRQVVNAMILATWYKKTLKESLLGKAYVDQGKVDGVVTDEKNGKLNIYNQYLEAFKQGVSETIKEQYDPVAQEVVTRKYVSGGFGYPGKVKTATGLDGLPPEVRSRLRTDFAALSERGVEEVRSSLKPVGDAAVLASLKDDEVGVSSSFLRSMNVVAYNVKAKEISDQLKKLTPNEQGEITKNGIVFIRRKLGLSHGFGFKRKDWKKFKEAFHLKIQEETLKTLESLKEDEYGLSQSFFKSMNVVYSSLKVKEINDQLKKLTPNAQGEVTKNGIMFIRRKLGGNPIFVFKSKDWEKFIEAFNLKILEKKLEILKENEYGVSATFLNSMNVVGSRWKASEINNQLRKLTPNEQGDVVSKGIVFIPRRVGIISGFGFKSKDWEKLVKNFGLTLNRDIDERIDQLNISEAVALLGNDPLRLAQYLRIMHPELSAGEMDEVAVASLNGLRARWGEQEELHVDFEETLSQPTVKADPETTNLHSFALSGQVAPGVPFVQVIGAYTRKIVVRSDGTFSANIPLPRTGENNEFQVYAFNAETKIKSLSVAIHVQQTGTKEDEEQAFLRLLELKEDVLAKIKENPQQYRFLLRSIELGLLKYFIYSEEEGLRHVRQLIDQETSNTRRILLEEILKKFEKILEMKLNLKPGTRLYFFQKYTIYEIRFLMDQSKESNVPSGVIVANEQGLGKTVTALAAINGNKALVLTPNAVVSVWPTEEEGFIPTPNLEVLEGSYNEREKKLEQLDRLQAVTNIEFTRGMSAKRRDLLSKVAEDILVVDEADYLGSRSSEQAQGTRQIKSKFKLLLTATPFKRPSQLVHLLGFLFPDDLRFKSMKAFVRAFPTEDQDALNVLFLLVRDYTIRIRKADVFETYDPNIPLEEQSDKLPAKKEMPIEEGQFHLTPEQAESIQELFTDYEGWSRKHRGNESEEDRSYVRYKEGYFSKKEALRQIMDDPEYIGRPDLESPKHLKMDGIVNTELAEGKKILIFARYQSQVKEYERRYAKFGARTYYGGLPQNSNGYKINENKQILYYKVDEYEKHVLENGEPVLTDKEHGRPIRALDYEKIRFQNDPNSRILIATYDSGAVGVTLTAADVVVYDDLAPTYRDQYQAGDRAHRIDNSRKKYEVKYYWLQALYPESFLKSLAPEIRAEYFDVGTYDQVHHQILQKQGRIFHRIMDGVGSERELIEVDQKDMSRKMPFLFRTGESQEEGNSIDENGSEDGEFEEVDPETTDKAMSAQESTDLGGIDLNPANTHLQIQRDPGQMEMPLQFQGIENLNIQGLTPIIINITPAIIPNFFSGLEKTDEPELSLAK